MEIDKQILVMLGHRLVYADQFDIEGLVSSPYGPGPNAGNHDADDRRKE